MDEIFIQYPGLFVFGKGVLTQRERPEEFIEAERQRIADAEKKPLGMEITKDSAITHYERV